MTYSKLGNIRGPQGRRGLNMTGNPTPPSAADDSVLEGDLWLDSVTGDVYRAIDPWVKNDDMWVIWGTVLWTVINNVLMVQPAKGDTGTLGTAASDGWDNPRTNPYNGSITSVKSKGTIAMDTNSNGLFSGYTSLTDISALSGWDVSGVTSLNTTFYGCSSLTDISALSNWDVSNVTVMKDIFSNCISLTSLSPISNWDVSKVTTMWSTFSSCPSITNLSALSGWDVSGVTDMSQMFSGCSSLTDASALSNWDVSNVTVMSAMFSRCPLERIGIPSLAHGGKNFVSKFKDAAVVTNMDTTMLTNTTTHETMSANQILTDMDANSSKYATGTVWTL